MLFFWVLLIFATSFISHTNQHIEIIRVHRKIEKQSDYKFSKDFKFGVTTSAYQIEGAWNINGKGENIWDRLTHNQPNWVVDGSNGDIACDSYHKLEEDLNILQWLGLDFYRFSISWSRLLPTGYANYINPDGIRYYNELINGLLQRNITPLVTIYHFDLPQPLQEAGGWPNIMIADYYEDYVRVLFKLFGDRVKMWITFNEPSTICDWGYARNLSAPGYVSNGIGEYLCARTLLIAHAKAYHLYHREFNADKQGKIGMTVQGIWFYPYTNSSEDKDAVEKVQQMFFGQWIHPIYSKVGDYPAIMKESIAKNSENENFPRSRLIPFTEAEVEFIRGTYDFLGLNHYTTLLASSNISSQNWPVPSYDKDVGVKLYIYPNFSNSSAFWLHSVPSGFRKILNWIKKEYDNPTVIITENGYADNGELHDMDRINYHKDYLKALWDAIYIDNCNVKGYSVWTLFDNFEFREGFREKFGLIKVDMESPNRTRSIKDSAIYYKEVIRNRTPVFN